MKCICGYEHESGMDDDGEYQKNLKGDEEFIRIVGSTFKKYLEFGEYEEVSLFACPKCKTVQMSEKTGWQAYNNAINADINRAPRLGGSIKSILARLLPGIATLCLTIGEGENTMLENVFILQMSFDEGVHAQWCFKANTEMDVWRHVLDHREDFETLFKDTAVPGELNERGYTKHLKDIDNLTPERLESICEESYVDGDSWPGVELLQTVVLDVRA